MIQLSTKIWVLPTKMLVVHQQLLPLTPCPRSLITASSLVLTEGCSPEDSAWRKGGLRRQHHPWFQGTPAEGMPKAEHPCRAGMSTVDFRCFAAAPC